MLAVDLDDELPCHTGKVRKIRADRMLPPEFQSAHAMSAQKFPYLLLSEAIGQAKVSRPLDPFLDDHPPLLASPPATRAERNMRLARSDVAVAQIRGIAAATLVVLLDRREAIVAPRCLLDVVAVHARGSAAEDRLLDRAVGRAELGKAMLLAHVLRDLEPAQALDLPLRRTGPQRVGAPHHVVGAHALDQHAHQRRTK